MCFVYCEAKTEPGTSSNRAKNTNRFYETSIDLREHSIDVTGRRSRKTRKDPLEGYVHIWKRLITMAEAKEICKADLTF